MKSTEKTNSPAKSNGNSTKMKTVKSDHDQLLKFFEDGLKDIYWAEKALVKAIPKMIKNATAEELKDGLANHLAETEEQVKRVEEAFAAANLNAVAKKCEAMAGLIKEAEEIMTECEEGVMRDAGIIAAAQKVEHYEIATYGTLRQFAETLGLTKVVQLLEETLAEEKASDVKLTEVAVSSINLEASQILA